MLKIYDCLYICIAAASADHKTVVVDGHRVVVYWLTVTIHSVRFIAFVEGR